MISFKPTDEEVAFTSIAQKIATDIRKQARKIEQDPLFSREIMEEIKQIGFDKMEEPASLGGMELPLLAQVQIYAALAYGDLAVVQSIPGLADGASLFRVMDEDSIPRSIKRSLQEEGRNLAFIDEMDVMNQSLHLRKEGDVFILNGKTIPVRLAKIANHLLIAIRDRQGQEFLMILDRDNHPWEVLEETYYLGLQEAQLASLSFKDIALSSSQVLAFGREAREILRKYKGRMYLLQAAKQQGTMQAAVDYATEHTARRKAFGKVLAQFQAVSFRVSQMVIETKVVQNLILHAASAVDQGKEDAEQLALLAIHRAHEGLLYVTDSAVQLLGGHGFVQDYPVEKWMRDAQAQVLLYGDAAQFLQERGQELLRVFQTEVGI